MTDKTEPIDSTKQSAASLTSDKMDSNTQNNDEQQQSKEEANNNIQQKEEPFDLQIVPGSSTYHL